MASPSTRAGRAMKDWFDETDEISAGVDMHNAAVAMSRESFDQSKLNIRNREQFTAATNKVFNLADNNHDGKLTRTELYNAVENNQSIKGRDAQALAALTVLAEDLTSKSWMNGSKGIAKSQLERYADAVQMPPQQND